MKTPLHSKGVFISQNDSFILCYTFAMNQPKLILLYGFASSGKTTLAKKYLDEHPLALAIEVDQIISMMGQWRKFEEQARKIVFDHSKAIVKNHLLAGHDVLLPYLLTNPKHAGECETIAIETSASFYEVHINIGREEAIERLLVRGVWGEEGSPKLTTNDLPEISDLYDTMEKAMAERENVLSISSDVGDVEGTYKKFLECVSSK
jgi:predicted kinase